MKDSLFPWLRYGEQRETMQLLTHLFTMTDYKVYSQFLHGTPRFSKLGSKGCKQNLQFKRAGGTLLLQKSHCTPEVKILSDYYV